jgi:hypothetical protein
MTHDWRKVRESKLALRRRLAALPVAEKLRMLEDLHERTIALKTPTGSPKTR